MAHKLWIVNNHLLGTPVAIFTTHQGARGFVMAQGRRARDFNIIIRPLDPKALAIENLGDFFAGGDESSDEVPF